MAKTKTIMTIESHTQVDKDFEVTIGESLYMRVDFDDVHHEMVDREIQKMKKIIDEQWDKYPDA